ncbi:MAG: hypothetical protein ACLQVI_07400, partial [Polyangiaceae bacterium]
MIRRSIAACAIVFPLLAGLGTWSAGCGSDQVTNTNYGEVFDAAFFNPGTGAGGSGYGSGGSSGGGEGDAAIPPPVCPIA